MPYYEGIEGYLKKNPHCVLKVGYAETHGFLASFQDKKTGEKAGPNGAFHQELDRAVDSLEHRLTNNEAAA